MDPNPNLVPPNSQTANEYYYHSLPLKPHTEIEDEEEYKNESKAYKKLLKFIKDEDFNALAGSDEFKKYGVNHRFGFDGRTLLQEAYAKNKPKMVEWLRSNGADERMRRSHMDKLPMENAANFMDFQNLEPLPYSDSIPTRVVNVLAQRYFSKLGNKEKDPHQLFEIINDFIKEHKWKYSDFEDAYHRPESRDGTELCTLGESHLIYQVNCSDLSSLFLNTAKKVGIVAEKIRYKDFVSVQRENLEKAGVVGKLEMFDGTTKFNVGSQYKFDYHFVTFSEGWHFDSTLQCKYKDKNAIRE